MLLCNILISLGGSQILSFFHSYQGKTKATIWVSQVLDGIIVLEIRATHYNRSKCDFPEQHWMLTALAHDVCFSIHDELCQSDNWHWLLVCHFQNFKSLEHLCCMSSLQTAAATKWLISPYILVRSPESDQVFFWQYIITVQISSAGRWLTTRWLTTTL